MSEIERIWLDPGCQSDADYHIDRCWHSERPEDCEECGSEPDEYIFKAAHDLAIAKAVKAERERCAKLVAEYPERREKAGFDWRAEIQSAFHREARALAAQEGGE